jgi:hypothetical protein
LRRVRFEASGKSGECFKYWWLSVDTALFLKALCILTVEAKSYARIEKLSLR